MYSIKDLTLQINERVLLDRVHLNLGRGIHVFYGPSGSGKTTFMNSLALLEENYQGSISFQGIDFKTMSKTEREDFRTKNITYGIQFISLFEDLTVLENLDYFRKIYCAETELMNELIESFKMEKFLSQKFRELSGGQKQKIHIILGFLRNTSIILLDEPTNGLDHSSALAVLSRIKQYASDRIVIIITHDKKLFDQFNCNLYQFDNKKIIEKKKASDNHSENEVLLSEKRFDKKSISDLHSLNMRRHMFRYFLPILVTFIGVMVLFFAMRGAVINVQNYEFNSLEDIYGDTLRNISIVAKFQEASGSDGGSSDNGSVEQDISWVYPEYVEDDRIDFMIYSYFLSNGTIPGGYRGPRISIEGTKINDFQVESSNSTPSFNKLVAGRMLDNSKEEVLIPRKLLNRYKMNYEEVLGKKVGFKSKELGDFSGAEIVGVIDTTMYSNGNYYEHEDSFILSRAILEKNMDPDKEKIENKNFIMRCKDLQDTVEIANELKFKDIIPLGQFEKVSSIILMGNKVNALGIILTVLIIMLALFFVGGFTFLTQIGRKKEVAIYQINGIKNQDIKRMFLKEQIIMIILQVVLSIIASPLLIWISDELYIKLFSIPSILIFLSVLILLNALIYMFNRYFVSKLSIINILKKVHE